MLFDLTSGITHDWSLLKVIYERSEQETLVHELVDLSIAFLRRVKNSLGVESRAPKSVRESGRKGHIDPYYQDTVVAIHKALAACSLRFKDGRKWRGEEEWRYAGIGEPTGHRLVNAISVPYQEFRISELPVDGLVIGPAAACPQELLDAAARIPVMLQGCLTHVAADPPSRFLHRSSGGEARAGR